MGGDPLHHQTALDRALRRHGDVPVCEVAKATVRELRGPPRGTEGEVVSIYEQHRQAARGRVQGDAGSRDSAADDQDVERLPTGGQPVEITHPAGGAQERGRLARREHPNGTTTTGADVSHEG
jgi:hypothetical protein